MKFLSIDSPLMQALSKLADLMLLNLLFLVFSLPIITIGSSMTAMYRVLISRTVGNDTPIIREFWNAFRCNFKQATIIELILFVPISLALLDMYLFNSGVLERSAVTTWVCVLTIVLFLILSSYLFPMIAQFENTIGRTIKNAVLLAIGNLPTTILVSVLNALPILLVLFANARIFLKISIVWFLIGFAAVAWVNEKLLHRIFKRFYPQTIENT